MTVIRLRLWPPTNRRVVLTCNRRRRRSPPPKTRVLFHQRPGPWVSYKETPAVLAVLKAFLPKHGGNISADELAACQHALTGEFGWAYETNEIRVEIASPTFGIPLFCVRLAGQINQELTRELNCAVTEVVKVKI